MIKIGITGNIGSGKSVISEIFRIYNIPVFDADKEAKWLINNQENVKTLLINEFGNEVYDNGKLNKLKFAEIIFYNQHNLEKANEIIHPKLKEQFLNWTKKHSKHHILAIDGALLFEAKFDDIINLIITVYTPKNLSIERAATRDSSEKKNILLRYNKQLPQEEKIKRSDYTINNDNSISLLYQIECFFKTFELKI